MLSQLCDAGGQESKTGRKQVILEIFSFVYGSNRQRLSDGRKRM